MSEGRKQLAPPPEFQEGAIAKMDAAWLARIIGDSAASDFQRSKACVRAGEVGAKEAIPAMAALLSNEKLNTYARYGLEPIADPAVDEALRAALGKLKGNLQIGVINSINKRRDAKAVPALAKLMQGSDLPVARAAAAALGNIGAARELQAMLPRATGMLKAAVADACLACAERLIAEGKRDQGMAIYNVLTAPDIPQPMRHAAMQGIIRTDIALERPR